MRGKLQQGQRHSERVRIIPAHAGQTQWQPKYSDRRPDHPRACGANGGLRAMGETCGGSSPRMRGKLLALIRHYEQNRIIPAHAGQTCATPCTALRSSDHPRACGANSVAYPRVHTIVGSSPRMRGKRSVPSLVSERCRIIPAHAGQTWSRMLQVAVRPDHPRACGANVSLPPQPSPRDGSSPRMRGKQRKITTVGPWIRIIPAHAGQTRSLPPRHRRFPDHPRACGANLTPRYSVVIVAGSSPRMRGKQWLRVGLWPFGRIIPAHAGQTSVTR